MKSGILCFGLLLTFLFAANLASAQSCNPAACNKTAEKSACSKAATTTTSTAAVNVNEMIKTVTNVAVATEPACSKPCDPSLCTEEKKKNCTQTCPPGCCAGAKTVNTAEVKTAPKEAKSSKL